jgi:hypothetical protein
MRRGSAPVLVALSHVAVWGQRGNFHFGASCFLLTVISLAIASDPINDHQDTQHQDRSFDQIFHIALSSPVSEHHHYLRFGQ